MPVGSQESQEVNLDLSEEDSMEFSNEDYGDFEIPEDEFDITEKTHSALLEADQHRKKNFAKQLKNLFRNIELTWMKRNLKT